MWDLERQIISCDLLDGSNMDKTVINKMNSEALKDKKSDSFGATTF